jgi:hypothetical protein
MILHPTGIAESINFLASFPNVNSNEDIFQGGFKEVKGLLFLEHPPFPCMFFQRGLNEINLFLVSSKVLHFHVHIHNHTCLVLVSFPTKMFDNFVLMVTLMKPPLGAPLIALNPFVI